MPGAKVSAVLRRFLLTFVAAAAVVLILELGLLTQPGSATIDMMGARVNERIFHIQANAQTLLYRTSLDLSDWSPSKSASWLDAHPTWTAIEWRSTDKEASGSIGPRSGWAVNLRIKGYRVWLRTSVYHLGEALFEGISPRGHLHTWLLSEDGAVMTGFPNAFGRPISEAWGGLQLVKERGATVVVRGTRLPEFGFTVICQERFGGWLLDRTLEAPDQQAVQLLLLAVVLVVVAWLVARQILRPLTLIRRGVHRMAQGELSVPIQVQSGNEMDDLAADINHLARAQLLQNRQLEEAAQAQQRFFANVSHELKTPLTAIVGYTDLLRQDLADGLEGRHVEMLQKIAANGDVLLSAISDLLDLSRLEAGKLDVRMASVVLQECLETAWSMVTPQMQKKGLVGELKVPADPIEVSGNFERLRQIFSNLLSNAVKFTGQGTVGLDVNVHESGVNVTVWDTGVGMSAESQEHIFEEFVQANAQVQETFGGSGLGLSIVKRLVDLHGGKISLQSAPDQGSRFTVWLPTGGIKP